MAAVEQPTRHGARDREARRFDKTSLRATSHGNYVHRDYAAHFFRWGFAKRFITRGAKVVDLGCGVDTPLARVLNGALSSVPERYVGADLNNLPRAPGFAWATFYPETDLTAPSTAKKLLAAHGAFDVAVSYEVIEHMDVLDGRKLLRNAYALLKPDGVFLLSTPVFSGKRAANHVHEYGAAELQRAVEKVGFVVEARYGTFARYNSIKKVCTREELATLNGLRGFYDNDVAACFLAPLYPDHASNNVWVLRRPK